MIAIDRGWGIRNHPRRSPVRPGTVGNLEGQGPSFSCTPVAYSCPSPATADRAVPFDDGTHGSCRLWHLSGLAEASLEGIDIKIRNLYPIPIILIIGIWDVTHASHHELHKDW